MVRWATTMQVALLLPAVGMWGFSAVGADGPVSPAHLPIGDGRLAVSPTAGSVWSCVTVFGAAPAITAGPWMHEDGTFNLLAKPVVDGRVDWPHELMITRQGEVRVIVGNLLPSHPTGQYPITPTDDAYLYDRNPNAIAAQSFSLPLPALPTTPDQARCLPLGPIGLLLTGAPIFSALDAGGRDAVAHEIQDWCGGHPERRGVYHYHSISSCVNDDGEGHSPLVGYAFDGFGLYGHRGEDGQVLVNDDLDACHGHIHGIEWDGEWVEMYHYHATWEYPYTLGCYRGTPS